MKTFITETPIPGKKAIVLLCCILAFAACRKADSIAVSLTGTYTGKFIYSSNGVTSAQNYQGASINFTSGKYSASYYSINPTVNSITVTNTGNYQLKADSITFNPDLITPGTLQTAQIFLDGAYEYHLVDDSLIITKNYAPNSYNQYRLKKN